MSRYKMDKVAVDIQNGLYDNYYRLTDAYGHEKYVPFSGTTVDLEGRLIGKVVGYLPNKRYLVQFRASDSSIQIPLKECHEPNLSEYIFPAESCGQPKTSVMYNVWYQGRQYRAWIYPRKSRRLNVQEFAGKINVNGKEKRVRVLQDGEGKLYALDNLCN